MAIRVGLVGTGNAGRLALTQLIEDPRFELVGVVVHNPDKVGVNAGTLAGLEPSTGVAAGNDLDALIAVEPECIVYCAMGDTRPIEAFSDVSRILAAGIDVVGSAPVPLQYPWGAVPEKAIDRLQRTAADNDAAIFITGVDPASPTTSSRWHSPAHASASSRSAAWRSPTTPPTTAPR